MRSLTLNRSDTLLGKALRLPLRLIPKQQVMTVRGGLNKDLKWIAGSSTHGCWIGTYEHDKQDVVRKFIQPGMRVFDIGANAGFYTLAFSRLVGEHGHVWAFEPFAENACNLLRHVQLNALRNVTLFQVAVSDRVGVTGFQISESNSMGKIARDMGAYQVPTVALDDLVFERGVPAPELMKMDVEGAESLVLAGACRILAQSRPVLFIALHGDDQARQCGEILHSCGYDVYQLNGEKITGRISGDEVYALPATY